MRYFLALSLNVDPQSTMAGFGTIVALTHCIVLAASIAAIMPSSENGNLCCISWKGYL